MRMKKVRWGILGCSGFARRRSIPAMMQCDSIDVRAVASRTQEKAETFRNEFGLSRAYGSYVELLDDPEIDAVHIPLPNGLHAEWTTAALEKGKHVLCEKSFSDNVELTENVAEVVRRTKLQFMEGFVWRIHPQHVTARRLIDEGVIGAVRLVRAAFSFVLNRPNIRMDRELGGGSILDAGCYPLSAARFYFGDEPKRVYAKGALDSQYDVDLTAAGILEFSAGNALFDCSFDLPFRTDLEIVGDKGRIYFPRAWQPPEEATIFVNDEPLTLPKANHYQLMFEHFSRCILNNESVDYGVDDAIAQARVVSGVLQSIRSGQFVSL